MRHLTAPRLTAFVCALALTLGALAQAGCIQSRRSAPSTRSTPEGTVELFKDFARGNRYADEWGIFSPGFKKRLNRRVGRNVDVGDYRLARIEFKKDPQVQLAERALQSAVVDQIRYDGPDTAHLKISAGDVLNIVSQSATIRMVRLTTWKLTVVGDPQPYDGIVGDPLVGINSLPDGGYRVWQKNADGQITFQQDFLKEDVESYESSQEWYVDHLGEWENQFFAAGNQGRGRQ